jgi:DNA-binding NarL/FixJ family response regulator
MPEMDGIALARQFISLYPETKVLFMSGFSCPPLAHYITDTEDAFLEKPFRGNTLIAKIRNALNGPTPQQVNPLDS